MARSRRHRWLCEICRARWHPTFGTNPPKVDTIMLVFRTTRHYVLVSKAQKRAACTYCYISSTRIALDLWVLFLTSCPARSVKSKHVLNLKHGKKCNSNSFCKDYNTMRVCVCFLPINSGHQVRWTYQPGSHRRKVTHDFSSTFFLRCVPSFFSREGFSRSFPSSTAKSNFVY